MNNSLKIHVLFARNFLDTVFFKFENREVVLLHPAFKKLMINK